MKKAFVFPGQGSQTVGMGKEFFDNFPEARYVFEEVDEALKEKLSSLIFSGSMESLTLTYNAQPALMAVSVAIVRVLQKLSGKTIKELCSFVAGHSLGEYSALCVSGAITLADTARLLRIRGKAMQDAVPEGQGGMAALIGAEFDTASKIAEFVTNGGVCQAANDNGGGQVVISGSMAAIDKAIEVAGEHGIRKAVKLPVSGPFHSVLMQPAAEVMKDALEEVVFNEPCVPLVANVTASCITDPEHIKELLVKQVTSMVRWRETVEYMKGRGVNCIVELGSGKVLSGLNRRIDKDIESISVNSPADVDKWLVVSG